MRYYVNDNCIGCGLCQGLCPEVFTLNRNFKSEAIDEDVDNENAEDAMYSCPVEAIEQIEE